MLPVKLTYDAKNENCSGSKSPGSVRLWHFYDIGSRIATVIILLFALVREPVPRLVRNS